MKDTRKIAVENKEIKSELRFLNSIEVLRETIDMIIKRKTWIQNKKFPRLQFNKGGNKPQSLERLKEI